MEFTSIPFFIFLLLTIVAYYTVPHKYRNYLLLISSYYFYFSIQPEYLVLLIGSTIMNYFLGRCLEASRTSKNYLLSVGLVFNLGILFFFKYFNFFGDQVNTMFSLFSMKLTIPHHSLILPIGISFYTFMALGYILDVYWGDIKSQHNLLTFSLYLSFFPQILCGPIGRAKNLFKQFTDEHPLLYENFANGFRLIVWGLFKKMVVADNIGAYVDAVYNNIPMHSSITLVVAALLYPMQLYADFSGYTDIARGVAKFLGFDLMVNFRTPYVNSTSVTDYWKRNHISLTSWLKDYVFYPFMGTSSSKVKVYLGIFIMFIASGVWHGVGWMFIIWGAIQALYLITEDFFNWDKKYANSRIASTLKKILTYLLVSIGLVFFRVPSLNGLREMIGSLMSRTWSFYSGGSSTLAFIVVGLVTMVFFEIMLDKKQMDQWLVDKPTILRWCTYLSLTMLTLLVGVLDGKAFIYFQF